MNEMNWFQRVADEEDGRGQHNSTDFGDGNLRLTSFETG